MKLTLVTGWAAAAKFAVACTTSYSDCTLKSVLVAAGLLAAGTAAAAASTKSKLIAAVAELAAELVVAEFEHNFAAVAVGNLLAKRSVLGRNHRPPLG